MSCQYCADHDLLPSGGCGSFYLTTERYKKRDGTSLVTPVILFTEEDSVFDQCIEVEGYARIKYCPMCGERLVD